MKESAIIAIIIILGILAGANIYLSHRFAWFFGVYKTLPLYLVFGALTALMIGGLIPFANATSLAGHIIYGAAAVTMGVLLYLLLSVLFIDMLRLVTRFQPWLYGALALALTATVSLYGVWNAWNVKTTHLEIPVSSLNKEIRAMHLSDLHIGHFRGKKFLKRVVSETNQQNVDVVFLTGDLFDGRYNLNKDVISVLQELDARLYFIEGNHEGYTGADTIKQMLRNAELRVLENEVVHHDGLQVIGLNHLISEEGKSNMHATGRGPTIKSTLNTLQTEENKPTVLLHHSPDGIEHAHKHGVDLYLSGHTHAGQLFPITYIAGLMFDYNKGLHTYKSTSIFVSQGAGTFGPPMRVGTRSEITVIKLIPAQSTY